MASVFHLFSALPTELRLLIWKDAIRPDLPAAHILRLRDPGSDILDRPRDSIHFPRLHKVHPLLSQPGDCAAIPLLNKYIDGIGNDSYSNISAYLIDAGLWTAYHESRLRMQKTFLFDPRRYRSWTWTGYYISGGAPLYITIRYNEDLVIIQPDKFDLECLDGERLSLLYSLKNIGIEYRPEWGIELNEQDEGGDDALAYWNVFDFVGGRISGLTVWLIDHNLRRKMDAPPYVEKRIRLAHETDNISFYAADRKFSSIGLESKDEECLDHWEYINPVTDGDYGKFSLYFADRLYELYKDRLDENEGHAPRFGFLGWDGL
ncbi:hypothetical protein FVEG_08493 [Fusarium verticillioides 7600]|uniref:Uncharacterized protein n=1 Tax=Gibberella moniliformis (strain M3125 / FGSC 7600) TaxID=334819 RepID=W7MB13_GIBM7|nr:hypothetical protein FVEG_08493 [Fusarium verticillioides 7600]EWG48833.1 hypothetical protein FVEG_08493 [Fusarium verticillioides 7600]